MQWYYASDGERQGPVSQARFEQLVHAGTITPATLVWRKPMTGWQSLADVCAADPTVMEALALPPLPASVLVEPEAAPLMPREAAAVVYGGFWRRVAARVIDGVILWVAGQMLIGILGVLFFRDTMMALQQIKGPELTPEEFKIIFSFLPIAAGIYLGLGLVYDCFFLHRFAATPGKRALGLRVYRKDGSMLSLGRIIGRYLAFSLNGLTLGISFLVIPLDEEKRSLHDHLCDTRVVRKRAD
jgi:uncharacterized RDD family membrane protein YckC